MFRESFDLENLVYSSIYNEDFLICGLDACSWSKSLTVSNNSKVMTINRINVHEKLRGRGIGTMLMSKVCSISDKNDITLELGISPYDDGGLSYDDLIKFYSKFGFKLESDLDSVMVRLPK